MAAPHRGAARHVPTDRPTLPAALLSAQAVGVSFTFQGQGFLKAFPMGPGGHWMCRVRIPGAIHSRVSASCDLPLAEAGR